MGLSDTKTRARPGGYTWEAEFNGIERDVIAASDLIKKVVTTTVLSAEVLQVLLQVMFVLMGIAVRAQTLRKISVNGTHE